MASVVTASRWNKARRSPATAVVEPGREAAGPAAAPPAPVAAAVEKRRLWCTANWRPNAARVIAVVAGVGVGMCRASIMMSLYPYISEGLAEDNKET